MRLRYLSFFMMFRSYWFISTDASKVLGYIRKEQGVLMLYLFKALDSVYDRQC
jgi:hypothetical protein